MRVRNGMFREIFWGGSSCREKDRDLGVGDEEGEKRG